MPVNTLFTHAANILPHNLDLLPPFPSLWKLMQRNFKTKKQCVKWIFAYAVCKVGCKTCELTQNDRLYQQQANKTQTKWNWFHSLLAKITELSRSLAFPDFFSLSQLSSKQCFILQSSDLNWILSKIRSYSRAQWWHLHKCKQKCTCIHTSLENMSESF